MSEDANKWIKFAPVGRPKISRLSSNQFSQSASFLLISVRVRDNETR